MTDPVRWAYGVTTTPTRLDTFLPRTLESLAAAGFDRPRLFVDGTDDPAPYWFFNADVTCRPAPGVGNFANWYLGLQELFLREPHADAYAMFEDDIVCVRGLREYLERGHLPALGYANLISAGVGNWQLGRDVNGWYESDQRGCGAQSLVFDRETVIRLLGSEKMIRHRLDEKRGDHNVDGAIVVALRCYKREYVHNPSLVQHVGYNRSVLGHSDPVVAVKFPGEKFDARSLLNESASVASVDEITEGPPAGMAWWRHANSCYARLRSWLLQLHSRV